MTIKLEAYSEELEYAARVCHQLYVNINHIKSQLNDNEEYGSFHVDICEVQVKYLNDLMDWSRRRFVELIKREKSFELAVVNEKFPIWKDSELESKIRSEDLRYVTKVCRTLENAITHLTSQFKTVENGKMTNVDFLQGELDRLSSFLNQSGNRFIDLLKNESSINGVEFKNKYPFIEKYPEWIRDLFPYYRPRHVESEILSAGGSFINFNDTLGVEYLSEIVVEAIVPDSFIVVWYSIAAQFAEPGFVWKSGKKQWLAHGLEL